MAGLSDHCPKCGVMVSAPELTPAVVPTRAAEPVALAAPAATPMAPAAVSPVSSETTPSFAAPRKDEAPNVPEEPPGRTSAAESPSREAAREIWDPAALADA